MILLARDSVPRLSGLRYLRALLGRPEVQGHRVVPFG
jgi:hypothetical protein